MSDDELVQALRAGDERAFAELVDRHSPAMLAVARRYVASREVAEDVVQDTWLALLKGIDGFEGRSSMRTWLFRVLVNIAKSRGVREKRTTPVAMDGDDRRPTVGPERFQSAADRWPGHWVRIPTPWPGSPEHCLLAGEALELVRRELARLPEQQRIVVSLRDVDGYDSGEVCAVLELTAANQRVLLHRGRARIREALAGYFEAGRPRIPRSGYVGDVIVVESVITCPLCATQATETMAENACQHFYRCTGCGHTLEPASGDCCVFCSYGTVRCPTRQVEAENHRHDQADCG